MKKLVSYSILVEVLSKISDDYKCFYPLNGHVVKANKQKEISKITLADIRTIEPPKILFFPAKDVLLKSTTDNRRILLGAKPCDLSAIKVLDKIFLSDYQDQLYKIYRDSTLIISADCLYPKETCFCLLVGGKPFVEQKDAVSDINISFIDDNNLIIESFTSLGEEFINQYFTDYEEPSKTDELKRDSNRKVAVAKIHEYNKDFLKDEDKQKYFKILKHTYELKDVWEKESEKCVQCGGCNFICPSCYCFLIREASRSYNEQYRDKVWDVCHFTGYARVAGGANPRKYKYQRFRNRYQCKFVYRYENFGFYACTGCGRCIEVCPAKIDIRKVVRSLVLAKGEQVLV